ncbi:unnamed protein product [Cuscuta europaea]|uniref:MADS-box domain-containing protein n=1 Tax=Cuscuta europaea TaxID=41803 RepID=A0A9P0YWG3_CUSEU|nr:unnamed protein product [Cuscuta europaea]
MGRVKLEIKKIENTTNRQVTFSKRRNGLIKKAYELSVLCEVDVALILFSPSGRLTAFSGNNKSMEDIMMRYVNLPQQERGRLQNQEFLQRVITKLKYESSDLISQQASPLSIIADSQLEELQQQLAQCKSRLEEVEQRLRVYECDPREITTLCEAQYRERIFENNLNQIRQRKRFLEENGRRDDDQFGFDNWVHPGVADNRDDSQSQIFNFLDSNALLPLRDESGGSAEDIAVPILHMQNAHSQHEMSSSGSIPEGGGPWATSDNYARPQSRANVCLPSTYHRERAMLEAFISQLTTPTLSQDLI